MSWIAIPSAMMLVLIFTFPSSLAEDAFIILRYARNIAQGHGFVWNPGEGPVWGSTSILWTLLLALCATCGCDLVHSAQILNITLGIATIFVMGWYSTSHLKVTKFNGFVGASLYALSTAVGHVLIGFDVILLSFLILLAYILTRESLDSVSNTKLMTSSLVIVCFLLGLTRPEGLIIGGLSILIATFFGQGEPTTKRIRKFLVPYSLLIGIFILIIGSYFGTIAPNPLLIKSSGFIPDYHSVTRGLSYLSTSISLVSILCIIVWILSLNNKESFRQIILLLPAVAGFISDLFISQFQNVLLRFQFPITPLLLLLMPAGLNIVSSNISIGFSVFKRIRAKQIHELSRSMLWLGMAFLLLYSQYGITRTYVPYNEETDKMEAGKFLSQYDQFGYTIVVSEAGMIPYYCNWRVIDAWGLNDPIIAQNGISEAVLSDNRPDVVQFHEAYANGTEDWETSEKPWNVMTWILRDYCMEHNYTLAAIVTYRVFIGGRPGIESYQWYFVSNSFDNSLEIIDGLSNLPNVVYHYKAMP